MTAALDVTDPRELRRLAARLRGAAPIAPDAAAMALGQACARWRNQNYSRRREALSSIACATGFSPALLSESLDALVRPFSRETLASCARGAVPPATLVGFVMSGNVAGAGLHELVRALIAGAAAIIKTSAGEPRFFSAFAQTVAEVEPKLAARLAAFAWDRERSDLTQALADSSDWLVVYGDDSTVSALGGRRTIGFGLRTSGALVSKEAAAQKMIARALAYDVTLFEQRGCLSPHHVFVEDLAGEARGFANSLAEELAAAAQRMPPVAHLDLAPAAAIRRVRETARWRRLGGDDVMLWEGPLPGWTVVLDPEGSFALSPQYRTVTVSAVRDADDFASRLAPVEGRLEAFAVADPSNQLDAMRARLRESGVTHLCEPGLMQSPPVDWRHGGGMFLERVCGIR